MAKNRGKKGGKSSMLVKGASTRTSNLINAGQVGGTPDYQRVVLRYTTLISLTPNATAGVDYVFSGNGLFDPDITSTGSQPANYDDFSALYGRYRCYGSRIKVTGQGNGSITTGSGNYQSCVAARHTTTNVTTLTNFNSAAAMPHSSQKSWISTLPVDAKWGMSKRTAEVLGVTESTIKSDDTYAALVSSNPNHQFYWHIMTQMSDQSTTSSVFFYVIIDYDVEFFDRNDTSLDLKLVRVPASVAPSVRELAQRKIDRDNEKFAERKKRCEVDAEAARIQRQTLDNRVRSMTRPQSAESKMETKVVLLGKRLGDNIVAHDSDLNPVNIASSLPLSSRQRNDVYDESLAKARVARSVMSDSDFDHLIEEVKDGKMEISY